MKNLRSVSTSSISNDRISISQERMHHSGLVDLASSAMEKFSAKMGKFSYPEMKNAVMPILTPQIFIKTFSYLFVFFWLLTIILTIF